MSAKCLWLPLIGLVWLGSKSERYIKSRPPAFWPTVCGKNICSVVEEEFSHYHILINTILHICYVVFRGHHHHHHHQLCIPRAVSTFVDIVSEPKKPFFTIVYSSPVTVGKQESRGMAEELFPLHSSAVVLWRASGEEKTRRPGQHRATAPASARTPVTAAPASGGGRPGRGELWWSDPADWEPQPLPRGGKWTPSASACTGWLQPFAHVCCREGSYDGHQRAEDLSSPEDK